MDDFELLRVFTCMYCSETTLVRMRFADEADPMAAMERLPVESEIVWPRRAPQDLPSDAPSEVRSVFREASLCQSVGALRGAAGLLRACVEMITRDKGAVGANLHARINDLGTKVPALSADVIRDLHDARLTGNWSLHDGRVFTADEVADVSLLIEEAVEVIYVAPARRAALAAARTARRRGQAPPT
jgi:hypothetical protein